MNRKTPSVAAAKSTVPSLATKITSTPGDRHLEQVRGDEWPGEAGKRGELRAVGGGERGDERGEGFGHEGGL